MKCLLIISLLFFSLSCSKNSDETDASPKVHKEYSGPVPKPTNGYGSDGSFSVARVSFDSPLYAGKKVEIFYPEGSSSPKPTIFYSHPYGGEESDYNMGLFEFISKKGYVVVFAPYPTFGVTVEERYNTLWQSFKKAVTDFPNIIDKTKVGFVGHSFGGGASFGLAHKGFVEEGWGQNGRLIFAMAQWFSYMLTPAQLMNFPANTKLITQVYDDDAVNDHRIAIDIFKNINIPDAEKDFILVKKSALHNYTYTAEHNLPNSRITYDAYDYYAVYRLLDALMDYAFNSNENGKAIALGNGSATQTAMASHQGQALTPLEVSDNPAPKYSQSRYLYTCNGIMNPRRNSCE